MPAELRVPAGLPPGPQVFSRFWQRGCSSPGSFLLPMLQPSQHLPTSHAAGPPAAVQESKAGQGVPAESPHPVSGCRVTCTLGQPLHGSDSIQPLSHTAESIQPSSHTAEFSGRTFPAQLSHLYQHHHSHWQLWRRRPPHQPKWQPCRSLRGALLRQHCFTNCQIILSGQNLPQLVCISPE